MILINGIEITIAPYNVDFFATSLAATIIAPLNNPFPNQDNNVMDTSNAIHSINNSQYLKIM